MSDHREKLDRLRECLRGYGSVLVAYSGGVDSTLLAYVAAQELGERSLAVTAVSAIYPAHELADAPRIAAQLGLRLETVPSHAMENPAVTANPPDRCYHCKRELFGALAAMARERGFRVVADGTNADDTGDYRPGRKAAGELGVCSPLLEVGMTKADIRAVSAELGLPTAQKPAFACLASRIPYGTPLTAARLGAVDQVEEGLLRMGFPQVRVRHHEQIARIELLPSDMERACSPDLRPRIVALARAAGFRHVALDLVGYRAGSLNEGVTT